MNFKLLTFQAEAAQSIVDCFAGQPGNQGAINNQTLHQLTGSDVLAASQELRKLRDLGLIQQRGKGSATYYVPGPNFPSEDGRHATLTGEHTTLAPNHATLGAAHTTLRSQVPPGLMKEVAALGKRIRPVLRALRRWKSLSASELAQILGRKDTEAIRRDHLTPMIDIGELEYVDPDMERHPNQAYRASEAPRE